MDYLYEIPDPMPDDLITTGGDNTYTKTKGTRNTYSAPDGEPSAEEGNGDRISFSVPVPFDMDPFQSHIQIYMHAYKVPKYRAIEIIRELQTNGNINDYAQLWVSGSFTEFNEDDVKRGYKVFSISVSSLEKYASYPIVLDKNEEKIVVPGFKQRKQWFDNLKQGSSADQKIRQDLFSKANERFRQTTGKDSPGENARLISIYLEILDEEIQTYREGSEVMFDSAIKINDYWKRNRTNTAFSQMNDAQQDEYLELLDHYADDEIYSVDENYDYEQHLKDYSDDRREWYELLNEYISGKHSTIDFHTFLRESPSYRLRYIPPSDKLIILQILMFDNWESSRHFAKKLLNSMRGAQLQDFLDALQQNDFAWLKYFELNRNILSDGIPLIRYMAYNGNLKELDFAYREALLIEMSKSISDGYGLGMESNLLLVLDSTPKDQLPQLFKSLKEYKSTLLIRFHEGMDWGGFDKYSQLMLDLFSEELGPEEMYRILNGEKEGVPQIPFEKGDRGDISYTTNFNKETGKVEFSYTESWSVKTGKSQPIGPIVHTPTKNHSQTTKIPDLDPLQPVIIKFGGNNAELDKKKGQILVVPAIYLLYIENKEFKSWLFNTALTILELGMMASGVGAIMSGALKGIRLAIALAEIAMTTADIIIRTNSNKISSLDGGPEFLEYWNKAQMMIGIYGVAQIIRNAPEIFQNLGSSWNRVKENPSIANKLEVDGKTDLHILDEKIGKLDAELQNAKNDANYWDERINKAKTPRAFFFIPSLNILATIHGAALVYKTYLKIRKGLKLKRVHGLEKAKKEAEDAFEAATKIKKYVDSPSGKKYLHNEEQLIEDIQQGKFELNSEGDLVEIKADSKTSNSNNQTNQKENNPSIDTEKQKFQEQNRKRLNEDLKKAKDEFNTKKDLKVKDVGISYKSGEEFPDQLVDKVYYLTQSKSYHTLGKNAKQKLNVLGENILSTRSKYIELVILNKNRLSPEDLFQLKLRYDQEFELLASRLKNLFSGNKDPNILEILKFHNSKYVPNFDRLDPKKLQSSMKGDYSIGELIRMKLYGKWSQNVENWAKDVTSTPFGKMTTKSYGGKPRPGVMDPKNSKNFIYVCSTQKEINLMLKAKRKGVIQDPKDPFKFSIPLKNKGKNYYQIDHNDSVAAHWNKEGSNQTQVERTDWYNDIDNLEIMPEFINSSKGSDGVNYINHVGDKFKGLDE